MPTENKAHHDEIVAWAKGQIIQERPTSNYPWVDRAYPLFYEGWQYRVKPDDTETSCLFRVDSNFNVWRVFNGPANLKLTFDEQTKKLKLAEVLE